MEAFELKGTIKIEGAEEVKDTIQSVADTTKQASSQMASDFDKNTAQINADFDQLEKNIKDSCDKSNQSFAQMSASFKTIGRDMTIAGAAITAAITGLAIAGGNEVEAQARLKIAIENTGTAYDSVKDKIDALLESQMKSTNYSVEEQTNALNNLVVVTGNVEEAYAKLPLVLDLAAAKNIDLVTASQYVARAMQGEYAAMSRLLPGIQDCVTASDALAFIQNKVAGAAEATANPMKQLKNEFAALAEKLGAALLPLFKTFLDIVTPIIEAVKNWIEHNKTLVEWLGGIALAVGVVLGAVGTFMLTAITWVKFLEAWRVAQIALNVAMWANPFGLVVLAIVAIIAVIAVVITHFNTLKQWFVDGLTVIKNAFTTVWHFIHNVFATVFNGIMSGFEHFVNFFINGINIIIRGLNRLSFTTPSWFPGEPVTIGIHIAEIPQVSLPRVALLDTGAYVSPQPGGTIARLAANVGEYVLTAKQLASIVMNVNQLQPATAGITINVAELVVREEADVQKIAEELDTLINRKVRNV